MNPISNLTTPINLLLRFVAPQRVAAIAELVAKPTIMAQGQLMATQLHGNRPFKHPIFKEKNAGVIALSALNLTDAFENFGARFLGSIRRSVLWAFGRVLNTGR